MLTKILGALTGALAFIALIFKSKADRAEAKRSRQEAAIARGAQKTQQKASQAVSEGMKKEQEVRDAKPDARSRDHFE